MTVPAYSKINPLIVKIYEAALQPELWQQITLEISDLMNSGATQLLVLDNATRTQIIATSSRLCQEGQKEYVADYAPIDLRVPGLMKCNIGTLVQEHMILNEKDKNNNSAVTNFLQRHELENLTGANLSIGSSWVWFGTARKGDGNIYTNDELAVFQILLPHIRKALRLHQSIAATKSQARGLADIFNYTGKGIVVFNGNGKMCLINNYAEQLMSKNIFAVHSGRFYFKNHTVHKRFERALSSTLDHSEKLHQAEQDSFIVSDDAGCDYGIRLVRHLGDFNEGSHAECARVLLLISSLNDPSKISLEEIARFGDLFALTDAEKRAVKIVADLSDLSQIAQQIGLKPDSVRKQLKSAMTKTGVRSQKELIQRLERFCFVQMH